jgi:hypothetical protein
MWSDYYSDFKVIVLSFVQGSFVFLYVLILIYVPQALWSRCSVLLLVGAENERSLETNAQLDNYETFAVFLLDIQKAVEAVFFTR